MTFFCPSRSHLTFKKPIEALKFLRDIIHHSQIYVKSSWLLLDLKSVIFCNILTVFIEAFPFEFVQKCVCFDRLSVSCWRSLNRWRRKRSFCSKNFFLLNCWVKNLRFVRNFLRCWIKIGHVKKFAFLLNRWIKKRSFCKKFAELLN